MDIFLEALPALGAAWAQILQPIVIGYLIVGVCMGLTIGVFPGLGGIAGLSLLLPFMFGMDPTLGLALMIGMIAVSTNIRYICLSSHGHPRIFCITSHSFRWVSNG